MFFLSESTIQRPGPDCVLNCPVCNGLDVTAFTFDLVTQTKAYFVVKMMKTTVTHVVCTACHTNFFARGPAARLADLTPDELAAVLRPPTTFIQKSLAVLALLVAIFPIVGLVMAVIAWVSNRKTRNWPGMVSKIALAISLLVSVILGIAALIEKR